MFTKSTFLHFYGTGHLFANTGIAIRWSQKECTIKVCAFQAKLILYTIYSNHLKPEIYSVAEHRQQET